MARFAPEWLDHQRRRWMRPERGALNVSWTGECKSRSDAVAGWAAWLAERDRLLRLKSDVAALRSAMAEYRLRRAIKAGFNPNQPRDDLGRWTDTGAATKHPQIISDATLDNRLVQSAQYAENEDLSNSTVDLLEEDARGGHTVEKHVGKSQDQLVAQVREVFVTRPDAQDVRSGTFPSLEAASKLVRSILAQHRQAVDLIAQGHLESGLVASTFNSATGVEAVARSIGSNIVFRPTCGVGVVVVRDPKSPRGFTVFTAFPTNR